jgi:acetyltransferase-like isoleucine patch superfamily enzyme
MEQIKNNKNLIISTSGVFKDKASLFLLFEFISGIFIIILTSLWLIDYLINGFWFLWFLVPLSIYGSLFLYTFSITFIAFLLLRLINRIHPPKEGIFERNSKDWKYWRYRYWITYLPLWLVRALPLPWMDISVYRMFGVKLGRAVCIYDSWVDPEFVTIGDHTMTSLNTMIHSHLIYNDKLYIKHVIIGKNCIVGPQTVISPGTIIKEGAILGANSVTKIDQVLESGLIHIGIPAVKSFPISSIEEAEEKLIKLGKNKFIEKKKPNYKEEDKK